MKVTDNLYVAIDYRLSLDSGEQVGGSAEGEPLGFVAGTGRIIPGLESALMGREEGDRFEVTLEPEDAYGPVENDLFHDIPRERFPRDAKVEPGMAFQAQGPRGPVTMTVAAVNEDGTVTVDLNHPMAGKRLHFDVRVVEVREPREEEIPPPLQGGCACGPEEDGSCGPKGGGGCDPGNGGGSCGCR